MPTRSSRVSVKHLYLIGRIDDGLAREVIACLTDQKQFEYVLFVNSEGGSVYNELAICNAMLAHGRVDTVCLGVAMSAAAAILACGRRRFVTPNAVAMIHQVSWEMGWQPSTNLTKNSRFLERLNEQVTSFLSAHCGKTVEKVRADLQEDFYLFGQEIVDYGLADAIWDPAAQARPARPRKKPAPRRRK